MEALGIDTKLLIAQGLNFFAFLFIFKKFIAKPFFAFIDSAQNKEKEKEKIMTELKKQEEKANEREREMINEAKEQSTKILMESKKAALSQKEEMIKKAQEEADDIKSKAKKQLEEEKVALYQDAKNQVLKTSALIAQSALKDYIDEAKQKELVSNIMKKTDMVKLYEN